MNALLTRARVAAGAAVLLAFLIVPLAFAGSGSSPESTASGAGKKIKKLTKRVAALEQQIASLTGEQGGARPPNGPAGGDLTGSYPNPLVGPNAIGSAEVQADSLTGADVNDSSLTGADVNDSSLTGADVNDTTLTGADVADSSLTGADVNDSSLTGADVNDTTLTGADVADGSLTTSDYEYASGTTTFDMGSVAAQSCGSSDTISVPAGASNDPVVVTPSDSWIGVQASMTYNTRLVGGAFNAFRIQLCNITGAALDPPSLTFHWVMLNRP